MGEVVGIIVVSVLAGVVGSWGRGVLHLQLKRWRNARLVALGQPAIKDAMLQPMTVAGGIAGGVVGALGCGWLGWWAVLAAGVVPVVLFFLLVIPLVIQQASRSTGAMGVDDSP